MMRLLEASLYSNMTLLMLINISEHIVQHLERSHTLCTADLKFLPRIISFLATRWRPGTLSEVDLRKGVKVGQWDKGSGTVPPK